MKKKPEFKRLPHQQERIIAYILNGRNTSTDWTRWLTKKISVKKYGVHAVARADHQVSKEQTAIHNLLVSKHIRELHGGYVLTNLGRAWGAWAYNKDIIRIYQCGHPINDTSRRHISITKGVIKWHKTTCKNWVSLAQDGICDSCLLNKYGLHLKGRYDSHNPECVGQPDYPEELVLAAIRQAENNGREECNEGSLGRMVHRRRRQL